MFTPPPQPPKKIYNFELSYRGITTLKASDRFGGVEPYLISSFCRVPASGEMDILVDAFQVKQSPSNLGRMDGDEWMPSGGGQDANGNPSNPITLFNGDFPPYDSSLAYYSIVKVMEEDGGQGAEIAKVMGDFAIYRRSIASRKRNCWCNCVCLRPRQRAYSCHLDC